MPVDLKTMKENECACGEVAGGEPSFSQNQSRLSVISLFSGCGGLDLGFVGGFEFLGQRYEKTGFNIIWANEINPEAAETYRFNLGNHIIVGDIYNVMGNSPDYADVVLGGFPCQDVSVNGKMLGIKGKRTNLYTAIIDVVKRVKPKMFVAENVGGLLLKKNEAFLKKIMEDFNCLNYNVNLQVYSAADYGVPQTRERVFIVGSRFDLPAFSPPTPTYRRYITARQAIQDLERLPPDGAFSHIWSLANPSGDQGNRRLQANRPGYTIRAECHGHIQFHYSLPRRISMREAARIQSFPDSFHFCSKLRQTERQIGNAVPPVLAWHMAIAVKKTLTGPNSI
ncbi:MAG: DNA cytosine methyltransferase [Deltaproteobacteria bacterium]|jgi:DNA (cytosine-5)-methyltransferase 1|nr:DNA cytosine methyltransferase [Deltaproteobacteria bacterium]